MQSQRSHYMFFMMFSIFLLLNLNFTILRSIRNTLAVVDLGSGAHFIPFFELFGAMPGAFLMTCALAFLMNRFSIQKVFLLTMTAFLGFFLVFAILIYPSLLSLKNTGELGDAIVQMFSMLFFVVSELWKPALLMILFWGLVNQYVKVSEAKKLYAPLMLGGSLGSIIAGPVISICTSERLWQTFSLSSERWAYGFNLMIILITFIGVVTGFLYYRLWKFFTKYSQKVNDNDSHDAKSQTISIKNCISFCMQNSQLRLLSWIVIADYIAYSLGEVIFLEVLRLRFPSASDYCNYTGYLALWCGILTFISSLFITPFILQRCRWVIASLFTPICLLITEGLFFVFLRGNLVSNLWFAWTEAEWIAVVTLFGSIQYCLCRGCKYTLFDSSKELVFVLMPDFQRMKGKLIVDGLCARLGRGSASALSITLIKISGGVIASSLVTGVFAIGMTISWIVSTCRLGKLVDSNPVNRKKPLTSPLEES